MRYIVYLFCFIYCNNVAFAAEQQFPDCSQPEGWAASAVGVRLKNLNLSSLAGGYDKVEIQLIASEKISTKQGRDIFRQVHKVIIYDNGDTFMAITVNNASYQECSESGVDVYFVSSECDASSKCQSYKTP